MNVQRVVQSISVPAGTIFSDAISLRERFISIQVTGATGVTVTPQVTSDSPYSENNWWDVTGAEDTTDSLGSFISLVNCCATTLRVKLQSAAPQTVQLIVAYLY